MPKTGREQRQTQSRLSARPPEPGDEAVGDWPRSELEAMDAAFVERVEREIASGTERQHCKCPRGEIQSRKVS